MIPLPQIDHPRAAQIFYRLRALEVHRAADDAGEPGSLLRDDAELVALVVVERRVLEQPCRLLEDRLQRPADLALHGERRLADAGEPAGASEVGLGRPQRVRLLQPPLGDLYPCAKALRRARLRDVVVRAS